MLLEDVSPLIQKAVQDSRCWFPPGPSTSRYSRNTATGVNRTHFRQRSCPHQLRHDAFQLHPRSSSLHAPCPFWTEANSSHVKLHRANQARQEVKQSNNGHIFSYQDEYDLNKTWPQIFAPWLDCIQSIGNSPTKPELTTINN